MLQVVAKDELISFEGRNRKTMSEASAEINKFCENSMSVQALIGLDEKRRTQDRKLEFISMDGHSSFRFTTAPSSLYVNTTVS